jgi:hypothetical protein
MHLPPHTEYHKPLLRLNITHSFPQSRRKIQETNLLGLLRKFLLKFPTRSSNPRTGSEDFSTRRTKHPRISRSLRARWGQGFLIWDGGIQRRRPSASGCCCFSSLGEQQEESSALESAEVVGALQAEEALDRARAPCPGAPTPACSSTTTSSMRTHPPPATKTTPLSASRGPPPPRRWRCAGTCRSECC